MNKSGKTLTIFLSVISVLLLSITAISVFFFIQEIQLRRTAEENLEQLKQVEAKLQKELTDTKKQVFLLEEKNKEANDKVEGLMEDLELEQGLREEMKKENREIKDSLEKEKQSREESLQQTQSQLDEAQKKIEALETQLKEVTEQSRALEKQLQEAQSNSSAAPQPAPGAAPTPGDAGAAEPAPMPQVIDIDQKSEAVTPQNDQLGKNIDLDKIVVSNRNAAQGQVISVDQETDFVIVNLGEQDGIQKGSVLGIYRNNQYLGDVQVSRVLPEMAAADFIPPFSSDKIQKADQVVMKSVAN